MKTLLWAKIMKDNRLIKDTVITTEGYSNKDLLDYLKDICYTLDLETPIILSKHYRYMEKYNIIKFTKDDFVDYIDFDYLLIEKSDC